MNSLVESHCVLNDVPIQNPHAMLLISLFKKSGLGQWPGGTYTMQLRVLKCTIGFSAGNHNSTDLRSWSLSFNIFLHLNF